MGFYRPGLFFLAEHHVNAEPLYVTITPWRHQSGSRARRRASGPQKHLHFDARRSARRPSETTFRDDRPYVVAERHIRFVCDPRPRRISQAHGETNESEQTIVRHKPSRSAFDFGAASSPLPADGDRAASAIGSEIRIFICGLRRLAPHDVPPLQGRTTWAQ